MDNVLQIPIEAADASWKETCNQRMETLKTAPFLRTEHGSCSSQQGLLHEQPSGDKKIMMAELHNAVENGIVDGFLDVLGRVSAEKELPVSAIFDQVNEAGDSLLHVAAFFGRERIAELISDRFPELLFKGNIRGDTALHVAARSKKTGVIRVILSQSAKEKDLKITRLTNEYGNTALHEAVFSKHLDGVTALLDEDRPVVHSLNKSGKSPLYLAVLTGDVQIRRLLLQTTFPTNQPLPQCHGNSPLHAAILKRDPDVALLEEILETRPEVIYLRDEDGMTPLHYAACIGYVEGVRILLKKSSLTALERDTKGHLPVHLACKEGHLMVVKELLEQEWPNPRDLLNHEGQNILHIAANNGKIHVVEYLLRNGKIDGFAINEKDKNGDTPLHLASRNLFLQVMYLLAHDKRIDVNLINNKGLTARDVVWVHSKTPMTRREVIAADILRSGVRMKLNDTSRPKRPLLVIQDGNIDKARKTMSIVSSAIVALTFAAGFTVPGGVYSSDDPNPQNRGKAVLAHNPLFQTFIDYNVAAMYSSGIAFLLVLCLPKETGLLVAGVFLAPAMFATPVAFTYAVRLVVNNDPLLARDMRLVSPVVIVWSYAISLLFLIRYSYSPAVIPVLGRCRFFLCIYEFISEPASSTPKDADSHTQEANKDIGNVK